MERVWDRSYQYNGKEKIDELGLGWNDYGARHYDALLGRWMGVDALSEMYAPVTGYGYVLNNPISLIDPDGMRVAESSDKNSLEICPTCPNKPEYDGARNSKTNYEYKYGVLVDNDYHTEIKTERPSSFDWSAGRGSAILTFPNSVNRLIYSTSTWMLKEQYNSNRYSQAGADKRLKYKTLSRNLTLGPARGVLNRIEPLKSKTLPASYWKTNTKVTALGFGGALIGGYGLYTSTNNIINAEDKVDQTIIEASGWAGAYIGAEMVAPFAAYIAPFTGPFAPATAIGIIGIGSAIGSFGGNYLGNQMTK